jgi:hypothetical protein
MKKILYSILTLVLGLVLSSSGCNPQDAPDLTPKISNLTTFTVSPTDALIMFDLDVPASLYAMVYLAGATPPSAATLQAQGAAEFKGTFVIPAGNGFSIGVTGLSPNTSYKFYLVGENTDGLGKVKSVAFTTLP